MSAAKSDGDGDRRHPRALRAPQHGDVLGAHLARKDVHVRAGALRLAEPDGRGLRAAAAELLPQQWRELARAADRQHVLA